METQSLRELLLCLPLRLSVGLNSVMEIADAGHGDAALKESSEGPEWLPCGVGWEPSTLSQCCHSCT